MFLQAKAAVGTTQSPKTKSPLYWVFPPPAARLTALHFSRTASSDFLFPSGVFLQLFTTGCLVLTATALLRDFNGRNSNIVLVSMFLAGNNYFIPKHFSPDGASYFLLHKMPIVQNPKSQSMCLIGFSLSWHAGLQPPAWLRIPGKLLHFCEMLSVKLEQSLRLHSRLPLPPQGREQLLTTVLAVSWSVCLQD